jgi:hypothetical protein
MSSCWDNVKLPSLLSAHGLYEGSEVWLGHFGGWNNVMLPSLLSAHGLYEGSAVWLGHFDEIFW